MSFSERIEMFAHHYSTDTKIPAKVTSTCAKCEFYTTERDEEQGLRSGKKECWKECLGWHDADFESPTVLDIWNFRGKDKFIEAGIIKMADISESDIQPKPDTKPGISASERQWLQIEKTKNGDDTVWLDRENLVREMDSWSVPTLHRLRDHHGCHTVPCRNEAV